MQTKRQTNIYIITECPYVGIFQAILDLSKVLNELGFKLTYVFPAKPRNRYGEKQSDHENILRKYGNIKFLPLRRKYRYIISDLFSFIGFSIKLNKGDIIISFTEYSGKLARLGRLFNRKIKYFHAHQCIDVFRKKKLAYYFELVIEKLLSQSVDFYITCSPSEVHLLQKIFKVHSSKIIFIPNYRGSMNNISVDFKKKYDFVYVGRIVREKGLAKLAETFSSLGICNKLTIIGDGNDLDFLKKTYPQITFLGYIKHDDVLALLGKSKFIISNSQIEGLPYSVLEAMRLGVVPILSNVHGHKDLVIPGVTGFLFKNIEEMRDSLFKVMNLNAEVYDNMSNNVINFSLNLEIFAKKAIIDNFKKYE